MSKNEKPSRLVSLMEGQNYALARSRLAALNASTQKGAQTPRANSSAANQGKSKQPPKFGAFEG